MTADLRIPSSGFDVVQVRNAVFIPKMRLIAVVMDRIVMEELASYLQ